jgi:hypothetical protein
MLNQTKNGKMRSDSLNENKKEFATECPNQNQRARYDLNQIKN